MCQISIRTYLYMDGYSINFQVNSSRKGKVLCKILDRSTEKIHYRQKSVKRKK